VEITFHTRRLSVLLALLSAAALPSFAQTPSICDAIAGNLVKNCGFELGTGPSTSCVSSPDTLVPDDWTVNKYFNTSCYTVAFDSVIDYCFDPTNTFCRATWVNSGSQALDFGNVLALGPPAGISQVITDTPGLNYVVTFFVQNVNPVGNESFVAQINGTNRVSLGNGPGSYTKFTFTFTGTGSDTLSFLATSDGYGYDLDDISVVPGCVNPNDVNPFPGGQYSLDGKPTSMYATFVPTDTDGLPVGLAAAATTCGYTGFDWQQTVNVDPDADLLMSTQNPHTPLTAPYPDPPPYGYTYQTLQAKLNYTPNPAYPFYWDPVAPNTYLASLLANETDDTLLFSDTPFDKVLVAGKDREFTTSLVGIVGLSPGAVPSPPLYTWTWKSTFNGTAGGVSIIAANNPFPADPGSGTGGVTITGINGVVLPPVVPANQIATTASGLAYSRVSQTFDGTVTVKNISSSAISGPLQIVFFGMPAGVTLVNAAGNLSGTPYMTVPAIAGLAPGQSVTVSAQFKNPANATINLTPVIYSGSIN
jgi:hypothetical protein